MPNPIPTLGYPSRTAAVRELSHAGLTTREIARRIGIDVTTVAALKCSGRRANARLSITLERDMFDALQPAAAARSMGVAMLAHAILKTVARDNMVSAILDDGVKP